jgi:hypothetical protein
MRRAIRRAIRTDTQRPIRTEFPRATRTETAFEEIPMATMVDKPKQPKPAPQPTETRESARNAVQQSMDRRW